MALNKEQFLQELRANPMYNAALKMVDKEEAKKISEYVENYVINIINRVGLTTINDAQNESAKATTEDNELVTDEKVIKD